MLAFELNIGHIVGLRTIDADLAAELNPGNGEDTPAKTARKSHHILLVMVQEGQLALANMMNCHLQGGTKLKFMMNPSLKQRAFHKCQICKN